MYISPRVTTLVRFVGKFSAPQISLRLIDLMLIEICPLTFNGLFSFVFVIPKPKLSLLSLMSYFFELNPKSSTPDFFFRTENWCRAEECPYCLKMISFGNIRRHIEDVHQPTHNPCDICGKVFSSANKLQSHKNYGHRKPRI